MCVQDGAGDEQAREKRKLEGATQAKFGIKNAVLGFVFGVSTDCLCVPIPTDTQHRASRAISVVENQLAD